MNPFTKACEDFQKEVTQFMEEKRELEEKAEELYGYIQHYSTERNAVIEKINAISKKQFVAQTKYMNTFVQLLAELDCDDSED